MIQGISLGWRCSSAVYGVNNNLRLSKNDGYKTCPFDLMVSNYQGMCKCIEDDFKYFCDLKYIELRKCPIMSDLLHNQNDNELWIYNTYYNFVFNHESPGHGSLYKSEMWENGVNHFVNNNFEKFIERYNNRINNFRYYINNCNEINFILDRYNKLPSELVNIISTKYPTLKFKIHCGIKMNNELLYITKLHSIDAAKNFEIRYLEYMNTTDQTEYERYTSNEIDTSNINDNIYKIINL
jgi:hypothetical protein